MECTTELNCIQTSRLKDPLQRKTAVDTMLEIIALAFLWVQMGRILESKGYEKTLLMKLGVLFVWFGGAIVGGIAYGIYWALEHGIDSEPEFGFVAYSFVLMGAVIGEGILFTIALMLKNKVPPPLPL